MRSLIKYILALGLTLSLTSSLKAQLIGSVNTIDLSYLSDRGERVDKYNDVKGSPFLLKDWVLGDVRIGSSEQKNVMLKYDEVEDKVYVRGENDEMKSYANPISEFTIYDNLKSNTPRKFRAGFTPTTSTSIKSFFEVLADGKTQFLKKNIKVISENREYSGNIAKTISESVNYYLVIGDNKPAFTKLDQKSILTLLVNKQIELTNYINTNKLNLKKQEDVIKLINYYNKLI